MAAVFAVAAAVVGFRAAAAAVWLVAASAAGSVAGTAAASEAAMVTAVWDTAATAVMVTVSALVSAWATGGAILIMVTAMDTDILTMDTATTPIRIIPMPRILILTRLLTRLTSRQQR